MRFRVLVALILIPIAVPLSAQVPDTIRLEPVRISVLRTPVQLSDAPQAVSVLGREALSGARSGAFLEEVLRGLPGVQVQNRFNPAVGERVAIRGFGARAQFGVRGVRVLVDGIPATLPDGQSTLDHIDIGTLGRVEAIRGPASSLWGNASGGVLSFESRRPSDALTVRLETVGGSHGLRRGQATLDGTVGSTGYLASVSALGWDGYRSRPQEDAEGTYGESERLGLNARLVRPVGGGELALTLNAVDLEAENPGSLPEEQRDLESRPAWGFNTLQQAGKEVSQQQVGLRWEREGLDLSGFWIGRDVVNPIPSDIIDLKRDAWGVRTRFAGEAYDALRWSAGFEADIQLDDRLNFANERGERGELGLDQEETVVGTGVFAQTVVPLPGDGELTAGLRWDRHEFKAEDRFPGGDGTGSRAMDAWSPSIGVHWSTGVDLFASIGSVFETPSTTELANRPDGAGGFNPELDPQRGVSGEVGVRGRLAGAGRWEVVAYRTNLRNELVPYEVPDSPGRTFFRNSGSSYHQGLEATVSTEVMPDVRTEFTWSWTDARFQSYELDGESLDGNRIPGVAPHRIRALAAWSPGDARLELSGNYVHDVPVDDQNTTTAPSHVLVDFRAEGPELGSGLTVVPWVAVTNLLDRIHVASVVPNAFGGRFFEPGPGRSFQFGLRSTWSR